MSKSITTLGKSSIKITTINTMKVVEPKSCSVAPAKPIKSKPATPVAPAKVIKSKSVPECDPKRISHQTATPANGYYTLDELKEICRNRGLPTTGLKKDILARLI